MQYFIAKGNKIYSHNSCFISVNAYPDPVTNNFSHINKQIKINFSYV